MSRILGIDLGTTNSLGAVFENGSPRLLPNSLGKVLTPSAVGVLDDGRIVVGEAALELAILAPERATARFKRLMGTDRTTTLGKHTFSPPELSSLVLRSIKEDAEAHCGEPVTDAVITVPAYFNDLQREATRVAAQLADLNVRRIVNEPTAAALTYGLLDKDADKKLLVFDLGGGTFDVTLMEVFEGTLEIISTAGESRLGGEDFTDRILSWALQQFGLNIEQVEATQPKRAARMREFAESAKRRLGPDTPSVELALTAPDGTAEPQPKSVPLDEAQFGEICKGLIDRLMEPVHKALRDGRCGASDVDEVILAGGATRMPLVQRMVGAMFDRTPLCTIDPDHVVAQGAAVQAALILDDAAVEDVVLTDVCPFTLGVEISKDLGPTQRSGYFLPVIHRNTTIPVSKEEIVQTTSVNQTDVRVKVFQGEARKVEDNALLGELMVHGIPMGPAGQPIALRFTYDINGLLEVEARIEATGQKFTTVLTHHTKNLSKREISRAVANLQRLKHFPRDDMANQRLLLFAERLMGEVPSFQRDQLEGVLDRFEKAYHQNDRDVFQAARESLLMTLSALGHPYDGPDHTPYGGAP